ncbi:hypothetical protein MPTK1_1g24250 [Marchantia polymorpha subsp. ruderalis]|uniref:Uncharacterized protein n=2 Tax=Marchantia polymorpha TaxID=3197 RepID=A0AAF6ATR6_MARPO|nr:hypothetical protein MARPO_0061s0096 [Marchantia polymorpha]BBM99836.1 hypothetical protein Mp_1g24250 [Marchantia polymorpha subsp. ruderalis]|eukprot:PTQ36849.1 hypothetical protein MARPO_0061s0096 [Marchantia polymorpha]
MPSPPIKLVWISYQRNATDVPRGLRPEASDDDDDGDETQTAALRAGVFKIICSHHTAKLGRIRSIIDKLCPRQQIKRVPEIMCSSITTQCKI